MCDSLQARGYGWKGWQALPPQGRLTPCGDWIDLAHPLCSEMPRVPIFPPPQFEQVRRMPEDVLNVTRMDMIVHTGTHIDAPRHFFLDGPAMEEIPLDRLSGRGVVWPVETEANMLLEPAHLEGIDAILRPGDILILNTGWHQKVGEAVYERDHPSLSSQLADWIVARRLRMIALDVPTPDLPVEHRPPEFAYSIHRRLLAHGILIAEHVTNLASLSGAVVEVNCAALNIRGGDGAPVRLLARRATD